MTLDELQAWLELCARTKTHADDELVYRYMPLLIDIARAAEISLKESNEYFDDDGAHFSRAALSKYLAALKDAK